MSHVLRTDKAYWHQRALSTALSRDFFAQRSVMEVMTPLLRQTTTLDPHIESLGVQLNGKDWFLQTSPEFAMKILLGAGLGDIYQLTSVFRHEPFTGPYSKYEFLMLEWYRQGLSYLELAEETISLLQHLSIDLPVKRTNIADEFFKIFGLDVFSLSDANLKQLTYKNINTDHDLNRQDCFDLLICQKLIPSYKNQILVLTDFPICMAAMAEIDQERQIAKRFEIYIYGHEIANGYQELLDGDLQRKRFEQEAQLRAQRNQVVHMMDEQLLESLDAITPTSGVALGLDRLIWLICEREGI